MTQKKKASDVNALFGYDLPDIGNMGLQHFDPVWAIEEHSNPICELLYVVSGSMELVSSDFRAAAIPGDTLLVPSCMMHRDVFPPEQDLEIFYVDFRWTPEAAYFERVSPTVTLALSPHRKAELALLFDGLRGDIGGSSAEDRLMARVRVLSILLLILREACQTTDPLVGEHESGSADSYRRLVNGAKRYMQQNYSSLLSVTEIAEHLGVSAYHLSHVFGQQSDFTVYGYLMALRMEKARALLQEGNLNVSEVAFAVGYRDPAYFSRVFRKQCGYSPSDLRSKFSRSS